MKRSEAREKVFQVLFQIEYHDDFAQNSERLLDELGVKGAQREYASKSVGGVVEHLEEIDLAIRENLKKGWVFERLPKAVIAILRLGIYEIVYNEDIPEISAIDEAVKLSSEYCDEKETVFINGILHRIYKLSKEQKA